MSDLVGKSRTGSIEGRTARIRRQVLSNPFFVRLFLDLVFELDNFKAKVVENVR